MARPIEVFRDSQLSLGLRKRIIARRAMSELSITSEVADKLGFGVLGSSATALDAVSRAKGDFFLLGSGSSVCDLSSRQWHAISEGTSIGFGPWALHSFVPDIYAFGPARGLRDYEALVWRVMKREDIVAARPGVILLRSTSREDIELFRSLPDVHHSRARVYGRVTPISRSRGQIEKELNFWFSQGGQMKRAVAIDSGSTLVRLISLGLSYGAKKIVLVGVDLNTVSYFWEGNPEFLADNGFTSFDTGQKGSVHDTVLASNRPTGIVPMVEILRTIAENKFGASIEIMSRNSLLSTVLPHYSIA